MGGGSSYTQEFGASTQLASILGSQWSNYQTQFKPVENQLINYVTNPQTYTDATDAAKANADAAFANTSGGLQRTLAGMGVTPTAAQSTSIARQAGLNKSLAEVGAMNTAATKTYDNITQALSGGSPNLSGLNGGLQSSQSG